MAELKLGGRIDLCYLRGRFIVPEGEDGIRAAARGPGRGDPRHAFPDIYCASVTVAVPCFPTASMGDRDFPSVRVSHCRRLALLPKEAAGTAPSTALATGASRTSISAAPWRSATCG